MCMCMGRIHGLYNVNLILISVYCLLLKRMHLSCFAFIVSTFCLMYKFHVSRLSYMTLRLFVVGFLFNSMFFYLGSRLSYVLLLMRFIVWYLLEFILIFHSLVQFSTSSL